MTPKTMEIIIYILVWLGVLLLLVSIAMGFSGCAPKVVTSEASCVRQIDPLLRTDIQQSFNCKCTCPQGVDITTSAGLVGGILNLFGYNNN
jgi:hypothetical protein